MAGVLATLGCHAPARIGSQPLVGPSSPPPALERVAAGRATRICAAIAAASGARLELRVRDSAEIGAFSWPSGEVVVTRGLLAILDDQELAAALAHEVGHLVAGGHLASDEAAPSHARSLRGAPVEGPDGEARADAIGVAILAKVGLPAEAMARMLRNVRASSRSDALRAALAERIDLLASR